MKLLRSIAALLCLLPSLALAGAQLPPVSLPQSLADIGATSTLPYVAVIDGQSNALGADTTGDKTVPANTFILDSTTNPTKLIPAQFGVGALQNGSGCTTSNTSACLNNAGVHFVNALRASGDIPASRPIVLVINGYPGESIVNWVGSGTASKNFASLAAALNVVSTAYPGAKVNADLWFQAEADNSAGAYATDPAYIAAFKVFLAQLRSLPQWSVHTITTVQELAMFADSVQHFRNGALRQMADGCMDPYVTLVSSVGTTESQQSPGPHFDGASLATLGFRHYAARMEARANGRFACTRTTPHGSGMAYPARLPISADTTLSHDQLRTGAVIDWTAGALTLPSPTYASITSPTILLNVAPTTSGASLPLNTLAAGFRTFNLASTPLSTTLAAGLYRLTVEAGFWVIESRTPFVGNAVAYTANYSSAVVPLSPLGVRNAAYSVSGSQFSLPSAPANPGASVTFYNSGASATTLYLGVGSAIVSAGGSGYAVGDTVTLAGGTFSNAAVLQVTAVDGSGAITGVIVQSQGVYSTFSATGTQGSTSGAGTGATFNLVSSGQFLGLNGTTATRYPIYQGQTVHFVSVGSLWVVVSDSLASARRTTAGASGGAVSAVSGIGQQAIILGASGQSGTLASAAVTLPSTPKDGDIVTLVAVQAVTSVTYVGGTVGSTAPTTLTAGQRVPLIYSSTANLWY